MGGKVSTRNPGVAAGKYGLQIQNESKPARTMMFRQLASALATGGRGMKMPFVQKAMASSRAAGVQSMRNAGTEMAGVDPSIRGRVLNRISRTNQQATSQIPISVAAQMIEAAPGAALSQVGPAAANFTTGISGQQAAVEASVARAKAFSHMMAQIAEGLGSNTEGDWHGGSGSPGTSAGAMSKSPAAQYVQAPTAAGTQMSVGSYDPNTGGWMSANPAFAENASGGPARAGEAAASPGWYDRFRTFASTWARTT